MLTSKYLTASLTALAVVGSATFVYAQSTPSPGPGDVNPQGAGALNQGTTSPDTGTINQGTTTPGSGTLGQGTGTGTGTGTTMGQGADANQGTATMNQDRSMDQRLAARADRN